MTGSAPYVGSSRFIAALLSSATKPAAAFVGQEMIETDTGDVYRWTGAKWIRISGYPEAGSHEVINELFHLETGVSTTVRTASSVGDTTLDVTSITGFSQGGTLEIKDGNIETTFPKITLVPSGTTLTLDRPLDFAYEVGDNVVLIHTDLKTTIGSLSSPIIHKITPPIDQVWHITRVIMSMTHSSAATDDKFGGISALTNGVVLRGYVNGQFRSITNWKTNGDVILDMYDVTYSEKAGASLFGTSAKGDFDDIGVTLRIDGSVGDYLDILIQDDITSLTTFHVNAQGHTEE